MIIGLFITMVVISGLNLYLYHLSNSDNQSIQQDIDHLVYERKELEKRVQLLEARIMKAPKTEIYYKPDDVDSPRYGGF